MIRPVLSTVAVLLIASSDAEGQTPPQPPVAAEPLKKDEKERPKPIPAVVQTTLATDGDKIRQFAFDGSADSYFASAKPPEKGGHFTLKFDMAVTVKEVKVVTGKPKGGNELTAGVLEGSADGKEFTALAKFADGTASDKPGKKLLAVRVAFPEGGKEAVAVREFTLDTDPPVSVFKNPIEIVPDATDAPEMKDWLTDVAKLCEKQYPMICDELKSDGFTPPTRITMTLKKDEKGVAYASGTRIVGGVGYFEKHKDDVGAFVHETAHCVQQYKGRGNPGWLVEGVADYVRFFKYEPKRPAKLAPEKAKYADSYRISAAFLEYVCETHDKEAVRKLNEAMRKGKYSADLWKEITGKSVEDLGRDWQKSLAK
jgi:hypothetical protein